MTAPADKKRFSTPSPIPTAAMPLPPTLSGLRRDCPRATSPATMAARPVSGPRHNKIPQTSDSTAAGPAGGFSPFGSPVRGSMVMAWSAMVAAEPVIGF